MKSKIIYFHQGKEQDFLLSPMCSARLLTFTNLKSKIIYTVHTFTNMLSMIIFFQQHEELDYLLSPTCIWRLITFTNVQSKIIYFHQRESK